MLAAMSDLEAAVLFIGIPVGVIWLYQHGIDVGKENARKSEQENREYQRLRELDLKQAEVRRQVQEEFKQAGKSPLGPEVAKETDRRLVELGLPPMSGPDGTWVDDDEFGDY